MKRRKIITELTALLDVVLIILFWALMNASDKVNTAQAEAEQATAMQEQAEEAYKEAKRIQNSYLTLDDFSYVISVSVEGKSTDNDKQATVYISCEGEPQKEFVCNWVSRPDSDEFYLDYKSVLPEITEYLREQTETAAESSDTVFFVIFQYVENEIYVQEANLANAIGAEFIKIRNNVNYRTSTIIY